MQLNPGQQRALDEVLTKGHRYVLGYGGSRSGKTALLLRCLLERAFAAPASRHLIVRKELTAARTAIAYDTFPAVWRMCWPELPEPRLDKLEWRWTLPNRAEVWLGGLNDDKAVEKILGREYVTILGDEISEFPANWFSLLCTRLAQTVNKVSGKPLPQRFYGSLNPTTRRHWTYRLWMDHIDPEDETEVDPDQFGVFAINPLDNRDNLNPDYLAALDALPSRARKRFFLGEYSADAENALWRREYFKRVQREKDGALPVAMRRIVVAIDPAVSTEPGSDETGIIAVGQGVDGFGYVIDDASGRFRPEEWARRAVSVYHEIGADRIVAEVNQGGDMVEAVLRAAAPDVPYSPVRATREAGHYSAKVMRAEPVAALYERGRVFHVGEFPELEDQMCAVTTAFDRKSAGWSPDRVDALVWGISALFGSISQPSIHSQPMPVPEFSMV